MLQPRKRAVLPPVYPKIGPHSVGLNPSQPARAHVSAPAGASEGLILPSLTVSTSPGHPMAPTFGSLVAELAAGIETQETICARYNLTRQEFTQITAAPSFQAALVEAIRDFQSISNTPNRVRMKAQLITELLLPAMHNLADNIGTPAAARVSAFSAVRSLTGMEKPEQTAPQQKFSLTINLGPTAKPVTIEASRMPDQDDDALSVPITQAHQSSDVFQGEATLDMDVIDDDAPPPVPNRSWASP